MIRSVFIISSNGGEVLIEKHYRGSTPRAVVDFFWDAVLASPRREDVPPVLVAPKYYLMNVYRNKLYFLAIVAGEVPPGLVFEMLHRIVDIFDDYFGTSAPKTKTGGNNTVSKADEFRMKENFSTVYQLLEEFMDNGFPFITEPNQLKAMVAPPSFGKRLIGAVTGGLAGRQVAETLAQGMLSNMPWRKSNAKYTQNEIYFDIVEEIDCIIGENGRPIYVDVRGSIQVNCRLSGLPDLELNFEDPSMMSGPSFHPCVRLKRFEQDHTVSFVPPDGRFELMTYRATRRFTQIPCPIYCKPQIGFGRQHDLSDGQAPMRVHISVMVGPKPMKGIESGTHVKDPKAEDIVVQIPMPARTLSCNLEANHGKVVTDEVAKQCKWIIGRVPKEKSPHLKGDLRLPPNSLPGDNALGVELSFKVPSYALSGVKVERLELVRPSTYKPYKGVRYITRAGRFQIRC